MKLFRRVTDWFAWGMVLNYSTGTSLLHLHLNHKMPEFETAGVTGPVSEFPSIVIPTPDSHNPEYPEVVKIVPPSEIYHWCILHCFLGSNSFQYGRDKYQNIRSVQ